MAIIGKREFLGQYFTNFILLISYFLIPWTAINLVDYYVLRTGEYNIKDMFDLNGQYGKVNWITTFSFLISIIVEIPFINTSIYVGPIAQALGGADLAWIVGLIVPSLLYYVMMKRKLYHSPKVSLSESKTTNLLR